MNVSKIADVLESLAPVASAAPWDNVGLLLGDPRRPVRTLIVCIDLTAPVVQEARAAGAAMVMAYHPPIFKSLSRLTASDQPALYAAARAGLAVYSMHTALDAAPGGTHDVLADLLGLVDARPLEPGEPPPQCKIVVFAPQADLRAVSRAAFAAGAGHVGDYADCSFGVRGTGTFRGGAGAHPAVGHAGRFERTEELRLEFIAPRSAAARVAAAIRSAHSYEEPAIDVYPLAAVDVRTGQGRRGTLARPAAPARLIRRIKGALGADRVLAAGLHGRTVTTAACGAGSCGSLYQSAAAAGATFYLTGEMRHHDVLAAANTGMTVVCVGHWTSERIALPPLRKRLAELLPNVKIVISRKDREPFTLR